jgi:hypothetical protein
MQWHPLYDQMYVLRTHLCAALLLASVFAACGSSGRTPARTPALDPAPLPPSGRPFPAPVTTGTYNVPSSIDATGATDASTALNAWTETVPDGSTLSFPAGATFRLDQGLLLAGRSNIVLVGNGAELRLQGAGDDEAATAFLLRGSDHVAIRDFVVVGNNPNTTTLFAEGGLENQHVVGLSGWYGGAASSHVEISEVTASHVYGDGAYLEGRNVDPGDPSRHVWIHHNDWSYIGRNAISSINVTDLLVEDNEFDKIGGAAWDIEPNFAREQVRNNVFRRNTVGSFGHLTQFAASFVVSYNEESSTVDGLTVSENVVAGNPESGYDGTPRGLNSKFISPATNIVFTNNTTTQRARGPVLEFADIAGVTVSGNVQPLISGQFARFSNCAAVSYS